MAIATSGEVKLGSCGLTASWRSRWHAFIVGHGPEPGFSCGQRHLVGSGQQQVTLVENVRSCEIGTVSATTMATMNVAIAEVAARGFTSAFGQMHAGVSTVRALSGHHEVMQATRMLVTNRQLASHRRGN